MLLPSSCSPAAHFKNKLHYIRKTLNKQNALSVENSAHFAFCLDVMQQRNSHSSLVVVWDLKKNPKTTIKYKHTRMRTYLYTHTHTHMLSYHNYEWKCYFLLFVSKNKMFAASVISHLLANMDKMFAACWAGLRPVKHEECFAVCY